MPAPPSKALLFPAGSLAPADAKAYFDDLYDYIVALLGASGNAADALTALGVSAFVQTILDDANAAAVRATIDAQSATGTTTNDSASAGKVGERLSASRSAGTPAALTTATPINITSVSLTAGDWDVGGQVGWSFMNNTTIAAASLSLTSATQDADNRIYTRVSVGSLVGIYESALPLTRISLATTTTVYLVGEATFGTGTNSAYGRVIARRVR